VAEFTSGFETARFKAMIEAAAFDAAAWDRQWEDDAGAGKLDGLAEKALADHRAGRSRELRCRDQDGRDP
jgi:hypothetical protein